MSANATLFGYDTSTPVEGKLGTWRPVVVDSNGNLLTGIGRFAQITDVASTALTTTTTSGTILNQGAGFVVNVRVTAVTGTTPTLDIRIEESFDGGNTWEVLYEIQQITANGSYSTPVLRSVGSLIRYVQTVAGTTPSFTHSIVRTVVNDTSPEPQKRRFDRTVSLTTLNATTAVLFAGSANNAQLVINLGAVTTTAPALQLQGSEDNVNWFNLGNPLTGVASSTVSLTINGSSNTFLRAIVTTAGVGVTPGYVLIKAWS